MNRLQICSYQKRYQNFDHLARLGDHLGGNPDPLHAAAKGEAEQDGEGGEDDGQNEPKC